MQTSTTMMETLDQLNNWDKNEQKLRYDWKVAVWSLDQWK